MGSRATNEFKVVCLQRYPEYFEQTINLLNNQWPKSRAARMRILEQGSKDSLPTCLVLLQKQDNGKQSVVAHSKISPVPYKSEMCFVESVVVEPRLRGMGLGRMIMEETEAYVKLLGIREVYLTTIDQQGFYSRLGYELCEPVVVFGGSMKLAERADNAKLFCFSHHSATSSQIQPVTVNDDEIKAVPSVSTTNCPPPPPPPVPPIISINNNVLTSKVTMRKCLN